MSHQTHRIKKISYVSDSLDIKLSLVIPRMLVLKNISTEEITAWAIHDFVNKYDICIISVSLNPQGIHVTNMMPSKYKVEMNDKIIAIKEKYPVTFPIYISGIGYTSSE